MNFVIHTTNKNKVAVVPQGGSAPFRGVHALTLAPSSTFYHVLNPRKNGSMVLRKKPSSFLSLRKLHRAGGITQVQGFLLSRSQRDRVRHVQRSRMKEGVVLTEADVVRELFG